MREKFKYAGQTVKVKEGVGNDYFGTNMSGEDFTIEDWCENVLGCSWTDADGNPAAIEYAIRHISFGRNNNVPPFSNDVVYGKIDGLGHLFHINELELPE